MIFKQKGNVSRETFLFVYDKYFDHNSRYSITSAPDTQFPAMQAHL